MATARSIKRRRRTGDHTFSFDSNSCGQSDGPVEATSVFTCNDPAVPRFQLAVRADVNPAKPIALPHNAG